LSMTNKQSKSEVTREKILGAAIDLFRERGFDQATMREIAAAAGVALGGAYYYFESKEALVMAFYEKAQREMDPLLEAAIAEAKNFEESLRAILRVKLDYFQEDRALLGALSSHTNPKDPLSPFSKETAAIREHDIEYFARALTAGQIAGKLKIPADLSPHLPRVLWIYQMGLILYWVYDDSPGQERTGKLVEKSLRIVLNLVRFSSFPLMRPVRKQAVDLMLSIYRE
jgi:AcrR family transcriptional regulator